MALEKPVIPTFSLSERDRRWGLLRKEMKKAGLHALISLPNEGHWDQFGADTRYLTQIGGFQTEVGAVFPQEGEVTAVVRGANEIEWWGLAQNWVRDIRPSRRSYGEPVIERLKELRAERVGVIGLSGLVRAPEGVHQGGAQPVLSVRGGHLHFTGRRSRRPGAQTPARRQRPSTTRGRCSARSR